MSEIGRAEVRGWGLGIWSVLQVCRRRKNQRRKQRIFKKTENVMLQGLHRRRYLK